MAQSAAANWTPIAPVSKSPPGLLFLDYVAFESRERAQ
jgi:hypothetical protein